MLSPIGDSGLSSPAESLDFDARVLHKAAVIAGVATKVIWATRQGGRRKPWLHLHLKGASFLYANGVLLASDPDGNAFRHHINGRAPSVTSNKWRTSNVLRELGFSVPVSRLYELDQIEEAVAFANMLGSACVKPNKGAQGLYVYPDLRDELKVRAAIRKAGRVAGGILVEQQVAGEVIRFFYVSPSIVAAKESRRPMVCGDSSAPVSDLIEKFNKDQAMIAWNKPIALGRETLRMLYAQGLGPDSVLENGVSAYLGYCSNVSRGGVGYRCDDIHPSYFEIAQQAFHALPEMRIGAIDMMIAQRREAAVRSNHWILEMNSSPGLDDFAVLGEDCNVAKKVVSFLIEEYGLAL